MSADEFEHRFPDHGTILENEILVRMDEAGTLYGKLFYQYSKSQRRLFINYVETTRDENLNVRRAGISTQLLRDALELNPGTRSIEASLSSVNEEVMLDHLKLISVQTGRLSTPTEAAKETPLFRSLSKLGFTNVLQIQLRPLVDTPTSPLQWHLIVGL